MHSQFEDSQTMSSPALAQHDCSSEEYIYANESTDKVVDMDWDYSVCNITQSDIGSDDNVDSDDDLLD
jgi:hypothetical protein